MWIKINGWTACHHQRMLLVKTVVAPPNQKLLLQPCSPGLIAPNIMCVKVLFWAQSWLMCGESIILHLEFTLHYCTEIFDLFLLLYFLLPHPPLILFSVSVSGQFCPSPTYSFILPLSSFSLSLSPALSAYLTLDRFFFPLQLISSSLMPSSLSSSFAPWGNVQLYIINLTALPSATMPSCHEVYWSHGCTPSAYRARRSSQRQWEESQLPLICPSWWLHWLSS